MSIRYISMDVQISRDYPCALAEQCASLVVGDIERLGFKVSPFKTEAVVFFLGVSPASFPFILVGGHFIQLSLQIKYKGITLDNKWSFENHFETRFSRVERLVLALRRIMLNLCGPGERRRRLYSSVVQSIIYYGAPI